MLVTTYGDFVISNQQGGVPIRGRERNFPPRLQVFNGMMGYGDLSAYVPSLTNIFSMALLFGGGYFFCRYRCKKGKI
jgi:hypothetical protein